jgi:signal peptidase II
MRSWLFFALVLGIGITLDQLSKQWAEVQVQPRGIVTVVPELLDLRYVRNPGAFFSLGAELSPTIRRGWLVTTSLCVLALLAWLYQRTTHSQWRLRVALALLASGASGNLIDRIRRGEVVDFVHLHVGPVLRWATFNVADVLITFGLVLLAVDWVRPRAEPREVGRLTKPAPVDGGY